MKHNFSDDFLMFTGLLIILGVIFISVEAKAQELEPVPAQNQVQALEKEERVQQREEKGEQRGEILQERVQDRVINLTANVVTRLESAVNRFENIIERLGSRIEKLEAAEIDTSAGTLKLEEAKQKLREVKEGLENMDSVREAVATDAPRAAFAIIKTEIRTVRDALNAIHTDLREVVTLLKQAVRQAEFGEGVSEAVSNRNEGETEVEDAENAEE